MKRIRARVKELTPRRRCHADLRDVIDDLNPVLRGWGNYFSTGNAYRRSNFRIVAMEWHQRSLEPQFPGW